MRKYLLFPVACVLLFLAGKFEPAADKPCLADAAPYRPTSTIKDLADSEVDPRGLHLGCGRDCHHPVRYR
jgi:hypothetical protein